MDAGTGSASDNRNVVVARVASDCRCRRANCLSRATTTIDDSPASALGKARSRGRPFRAFWAATIFAKPARAASGIAGEMFVSAPGLAYCGMQDRLGRLKAAAKRRPSRGGTTWVALLGKPPTGSPQVFSVCPIGSPGKGSDRPSN